MAVVEEGLMNVGVVGEAIDMQSLRYVFEGLEQSLAKRHKVNHRSIEFFYSSPRRREELHDEFVLNSDILVGRIDERVFRSRERLSDSLPLFASYLAQSLEAVVNCPGCIVSSSQRMCWWEIVAATWK
jgi:hypothetical protein